jgi:membrane protein insertase Oxa1/YidC/SpoIIIJ
MNAVLVIEYKWTFGKLVSVSFFYFTETLPAGIGIGHSIIIVSLSVVLLILVVDKRQDRHIDEIIQTQHKMLTLMVHGLYSIPVVDLFVFFGLWLLLYIDNGIRNILI